jgi:hypothetical protein
VSSNGPNDSRRGVSAASVVSAKRPGHGEECATLTEDAKLP